MSVCLCPPADSTICIFSLERWRLEGGAARSGKCFESEREQSNRTFVPLRCRIIMPHTSPAVLFLLVFLFFNFQWKVDEL